jgi:hypothetical protein
VPYSDVHACTKNVIRHHQIREPDLDNKQATCSRGVLMCMVVQKFCDQASPNLGAWPEKAINI